MDDKKENQPRKGCAEAFQKMHQDGEDNPLIPDVFEEESFLKDPEHEWVWDENSIESKKNP